MCSENGIAAGYGTQPLQGTDIAANRYDRINYNLIAPSVLITVPLSLGVAIAGKSVIDYKKIAFLINNKCLTNKLRSDLVLSTVLSVPADPTQTEKLTSKYVIFIFSLYRINFYLNVFNLLAFYPTNGRVVAFHSTAKLIFIFPLYRINFYLNVFNLLASYPTNGRVVAFHSTAKSKRLHKFLTNQLGEVTVKARLIYYLTRRPSMEAVDDSILDYEDEDMQTDAWRGHDISDNDIGGQLTSEAATNTAPALHHKVAEISHINTASSPSIITASSSYSSVTSKYSPGEEENLFGRGYRQCRSARNTELLVEVTDTSTGNNLGKTVY
jgi:Zn-dependent protease